MTTAMHLDTEDHLREGITHALRSAARLEESYLHANAVRAEKLSAAADLMVDAYAELVGPAKAGEFFRNVLASIAGER